MTYKKWIIAASAAAVVIISGTSIMAMAKANPIQIVLNGTELVTAKAAQKVDGVVMLPVKEFGKMFGKEVSYDEKTNTVAVNDKAGVKIAESEDKTIQITGNQTETGTYDHLKIQTPIFSRSLPGYNVTNPSYAPWIEFEDVTGDGEPEVVVILTTGYGTGVYQSNALVYNAHGDQILVEDALTTLMKRFKGTYTDKALDISLDDKHYTLPQDLMFSGGESHGFKPGIGSVMQFAVKDGKLTATTGVQVSPAEFVGDIKLTYIYKDGLLQAGDASFEFYPEYRP